VTQFAISCAVELLRLVISDDIMTSLLKKLSISIKIHVVKLKLLCSVSKVSTESVDADTTQLDSCVASASAVCIGLYMTMTHDFSVAYLTRTVVTISNAGVYLIFYYAVHRK